MLRGAIAASQRAATGYGGFGRVIPKILAQLGDGALPASVRHCLLRARQTPVRRIRISSFCLPSGLAGVADTKRHAGNSLDRL